MRKPLEQLSTPDYLQAKAEIMDATLFLNERVGQTDRGLTVIGFSLGAYYALDLSASDSRAHPLRRRLLRHRPADFSSSKAAYLGHFAENDEYEPQSNVDELEGALKSAGRPVTFYHYSGTGHWFL